MSTKKNTQVIIKDGEYIMPRAVKPTLTSRPKPAPRRMTHAASARPVPARYDSCMENSFVSLQDVANIVVFVAPGYFAMQVYSLVYAKKDRDFSRLLIESIIYSLPIVTIVNIVWQNVLVQPPVSTLNIAYALLIFVASLFFGGLATILRASQPIQSLATRIGLGSPDEDYVKRQLMRIDTLDPNKNSVTVKLKSGTVFSGTIDRLDMSRYTPDGPMYYYFSNLAWFNENTDEWDVREGGILIERGEIEYIETPKLARKKA